MVAGPVVNVEKPKRMRRLFQAAVGIRIYKTLPKATDRRADFQGCGISHRPFSFLVLFSFIDEFPCGNPAGSRYE